MFIYFRALSPACYIRANATDALLGHGYRVQAAGIGSRYLHGYPWVGIGGGFMRNAGGNVLNYFETRRTNFAP